MVRQRQVAVRVHADELAVVALQSVAGAAALGGGDVPGDDALGRFRPAFAIERGDFLDQRGVQLVERHEGLLGAALRTADEPRAYHFGAPAAAHSSANFTMQS